MCQYLRVNKDFLDRFVEHVSSRMAHYDIREYLQNVEEPRKRALYT